ncbi:MAG: Mov34/MPN/PAD-1 family protein [Promethearchaeota archaeon]
MTIIIPKEAYLTVVAASVRFANRKIDQDDWLEVNGVFIGEIKGDDILIKEAYPIMHQKLDKTAVIDKYEWSDEDNVTYTLVDDEAFSKGLYTVGSWHSHPGFKVMLSHIDIKHLAFHQSVNPSYFTLVFNPTRLERQVEMPEKKGNPEIQLKDEPGFKIFRLDDVNRGIEASYHTIDYHIEGYDSMEQLIDLTKKFLIDVTNFFPKDNLFETYEGLVTEKVRNLDSLLLGTEEYLATLVRKGESHRVSEVLDNQTREIRKFIAETYIKIDNIKQFMNYLEYKERDRIIPQVKEVFSKWDEKISIIDTKLNQLAKTFK